MKFKLLRPVFPITIIIIISFVFFVYSNHKDYSESRVNKTAGLISHIQDFVSRTQEDNEQLIQLLQNKWSVIDNVATRNMDLLLNEVQPYHDTLKYEIVNIYEPSGELLVSAANPELFAIRDEISVHLKEITSNDNIENIVVNFKNKLLVTSVSRIKNNYESVGFIVVGRFITPAILKQLYPEADIAIDLVIESQILTRSNGDKNNKIIEAWEQTEVFFPTQNIGKSPFTAIVYEDISEIQQEYWFSAFVFSLAFTFGGIIIINISYKLVVLNNELERTRREFAEQDLKESQQELAITLEEIRSSEQHLKLYRDQAPLAAIEWHTDFKIVDWNPAAEKIFGYTLDEVKGRYFADFMLPENAIVDVKQIWKDLIGQTGGIKSINENLKKDGSVILCEWHNTPLIDKSGNVIGAASIVLDVTAEHQAKQALKDREQNLAITLNSIGDAVITTDAEGNVTRMNPVAEQLTGWSIKETEGQSLKTIFPILDATTRIPIENPVDKVINTGETVYLSNHTTLIAKDGAEYQIADSAAPIIDDDGQILGMVLVFNDVTEQYQLREAAAKIERDMQSIMDHSPAVIYVKDIDGRYTFINQQFEKLFHVERESFFGSTDYDFLPKDIADKLRENDRTVFESQQALENEEMVSLEDGLHTYVAIKFPLLNEKNEIYAVCGISTDITERRQQEEQLRRNQKMDALGKLTGGIAHDYNNLLGIIQGYAELLNEKLTHDTTLAKYAHDIQRAAERGAKLTKKLLTFSQHKIADATEININALLQEQQLMLEKTLTARFKLVFDLEENLWPVYLDSDELENVILNMSINAMHAMENGGELTFRTSNEQLAATDAQRLHLNAGDYVLLSITDTGCGMDEATKEKIFDPFYSTKGEFGTGLGLSQVYGFVERSSGAIKVYSELGHGSHFALYFPRSNQEIVEKLTPITDTVLNLKGSETVLVVDDEQSMVELADEILTAQGYHVLTANDGKQALIVLKQEVVNLIITDVIMPNMDGYQLAAQVQKRYPHVKIQMVSGFADNLHSDMTDDSLHKNILHKPYTSNTLLERIRNLLDEGHSKNILAGRTVMVMDDEEDLRDLFKLNLKKLGCKVILASDGDEAITLYQQSLEDGKSIDVIVVDLSIPGSLNGRDVAIKIHKMNPNAKIIVSSGHSESPEMIQYQDYGFCGALEKNFNRKDIERVLKQVLASS